MKTTTLASLSLLALTLTCAGCTLSADVPAEEEKAEADAEVASEALSVQGTFPPALTVTINDPTQRARSVTRNAVAIMGRVSNSGIVPSQATVKVDGSSFQVPLNGGQGPALTALAIRDRIGPGYTARVIPRLGASYLIVQYRQP
jgi:hypothetical protein